MLFFSEGKINSALRLLYRFLGFAVLILIWHLVTLGKNPVMSSGVLPSPWSVLKAFGELVNENKLVPNFFYSLGLNLAGYIEAILISIPLGFLIGLVRPARLGAKGIVESLRYIALPAVLGLFIAWFGIGSGLKIHFLAFGILIYLVPVVIQRIDEVKDVYLKTIYTLGASRWQAIKTVYFPSVISRVSDDIRVLTAISWTYIIIAESIGGEGGIGALAWRVGLRRGRLDKVFAILIVIIIVGIIQDRLLVRADKKWFPHKYISRNKYQKVNEKENSWNLVLKYITKVFTWLLLSFGVILLLDNFFGFMQSFLPEGERCVLNYLFKDTVWGIWFIVLMVFAYFIYGMYRQYKFPYLKKQIANV